jgi:hypothetical protein
MRVEDLRLRHIMDYLRTRGEVSALYLFGMRKDSDAIGHQACLAVLLDEAAEADGVGERVLGGCPVKGAGDVVVLNQASPYLRYRVIRKGSVVFERDAVQRVRFSERTVTEFFDHYTPDGDVDIKGAGEFPEAECWEFDG